MSVDPFMQDIVIDDTKQFINALKTGYAFCQSTNANVGCENCPVKNICYTLCGDKKLSQLFLDIEIEARKGVRKHAV